MGNNLGKQAWKPSFAPTITFAIFDIAGKIPEDKNILNILVSSQEISFLSNFNILVGILVDLTSLSKFNKDMEFFASILSMQLQKREIRSVFGKSEKCFCA